MLALNPVDRARLASMLVGGREAGHARQSTPDVR
jgi:hypothetical protein